MLEIFYAPSFFRYCSKLDISITDDVEYKIEKFKDKKNHISLKVHKLHGIDNTYSFSVTHKIRIIFEYDKKDKNIVYLLRVGNHDDVY